MLGGVTAVLLVEHPPALGCQLTRPSRDGAGRRHVVQGRRENQDRSRKFALTLPRSSRSIFLSRMPGRSRSMCTAGCGMSGWVLSIDRRMLVRGFGTVSLLLLFTVLALACPLHGAEEQAASSFHAHPDDVFCAALHASASTQAPSLSSALRNTSGRRALPRLDAFPAWLLAHPIDHPPR
jgi:hypothetical protein